MQTQAHQLIQFDSRLIYVLPVFPFTTALLPGRGSYTKKIDKRKTPVYNLIVLYNLIFL